MATGYFSKLAFANGNSKDAEFVVVGVPFDSSSSFIPGARFGPEAIRLASWNLEDYILDLRGEVPTHSIYDKGNMEMQTRFDVLAPLLEGEIRDIVSKNKIPIVLGGEHSLTPVCVSAVKRIVGNLGVVVLDAHLDFRDTYLGERWSHACATRRVVEAVGIENVILMGARSACSDEATVAEEMGLKYILADEIHANGISRALELLRDFIDGHSNIYLSIDMDVIDPGFAPGVGTPEPYGLTPYHARKIIENVATSAVAMDIVEGLGINAGGDMATATIAAEFIRRFAYLKHHRGSDADARG